MGLDTVELVMSFEEKFSIEFPDEDAENLITVRDVIDYVYERVPHAEMGTCLSQRAFHRLRSASLAELGIDRRAFRPKTTWETLIPEANRAETWSRLHSTAGVEAWPELTTPFVLFGKRRPPQFPQTAATVGQLVEFLLANAPRSLKGAEEGWTRDQVRAVVRAITMEQLNVEPGFSDDAGFVDDLGAD